MYSINRLVVVMHTCVLCEVETDFEILFVRNSDAIDSTYASKYYGVFR